MFKNKSYIILLVVLSLILTSCGGTKEVNKKEEGEKENSGVVVDKGIITTSITVPSSFFTELKEEDIKSSVAENGFQSYKINSDGSVTYTMSKAKHKEFIDNFSKEIENAIGEMVKDGGENSVESFLDIKHNKDFSVFDIMIDHDKYTLWDSMYVISFYMQGAFYQIFNGTPNDKIDVVVNFIDNKTGENIESGSYKEWTSNLDSHENEDEINSKVVTKTVNLNETFKVGELMEITLKEAEWTEEIMPSNTKGYYSYYEDKDGEKYFVIYGELKNFGSDALDTKWINESKLLINENYGFNVSMELEDNEGNNFYGVAKPLQTLKLIIYSSVSDEAYEIWETIDLEMKILSDDKYIDGFFDDRYAHEIIKMRFTK